MTFNKRRLGLMFFILTLLSYRATGESGDKESLTAKDVIEKMTLVYQDSKFPLKSFQKQNTDLAEALKIARIKEERFRFATMTHPLLKDRFNGIEKSEIPKEEKATKRETLLAELQEIPLFEDFRAEVEQSKLKALEEERKALLLAGHQKLAAELDDLLKKVGQKQKGINEGGMSAVQFVESIMTSPSDEPNLPRKFNFDRPFSISINSRFPEFKSFEKKLIKSIVEAGEAQRIVFERFSSRNRIKEIRVKVGVKVELQILRAVLAALSEVKEASISVELQRKGNGRGEDQRIIIAGMGRTPTKAVSLTTLRSLLDTRLKLQDIHQSLSNTE